MAKDRGFNKYPENTKLGGRPKGASIKNILLDMLDNNAVETSITVVETKDGQRKESTSTFGLKTTNGDTLKKALATNLLVRAFTDNRKGFEYSKLVMERIEGTAPHSPPISDFEEKITMLLQEGHFTIEEATLLKGIFDKLAY